jgi:hypothetical protein
LDGRRPRRRHRGARLDRLPRAPTCRRQRPDDAGVRSGADGEDLRIAPLRRTPSEPGAAERRAALGAFILRWLAVAVLVGLIIGMLLRLA